MATLPQSSRPESGSFPNLLPGISPGGAPLPTVQLLHRLADDSEHVDWMIARDRHGKGPLVSFRLQDSLDKLPPPPEGIIAERIGDHRPSYLNYEGPVSGGRGVVSCLARGHLSRSKLVETPGAPPRWEVEIIWENTEGQMLRMALNLLAHDERRCLIRLASQSP